MPMTLLHHVAEEGTYCSYCGAIVAHGSEEPCDGPARVQPWHKVYVLAPTGMSVGMISNGGREVSISVGGVALDTQPAIKLPTSVPGCDRHLIESS